MTDDKKSEELSENDLDQAVGAGQKFTFKMPDLTSMEESSKNTTAVKISAALDTGKNTTKAASEEKAKQL